MKNTNLKDYLQLDSISKVKKSKSGDGTQDEFIDHLIKKVDEHIAQK